ncbi:MAG: endonuclease/exonuclease/phosphatase family protein [Clostridia bacterium]|nr:endonuclease/exonuclease/phosphatase family protein [Clostridia bacterium]
MKIMSFNTQHCRNYVTRVIDYRVMADAILGCGADIVGLNEIRDQGEAEGYEPQTAALSALTGMEHTYFAEAIRVNGPNPYGNALLSRIPIVHAETIPVPDPNPKTGGEYYETRCLLKAKLANGLTVLVIHFGLNADEQENAVRTVEAHIEDQNCILMGDFNVLPDDPVLAPIRARMRDTADVFAAPLLSFPSDAPQMKIDYIFVSPDIEVIAADIPAIVASDHRPHTAEIALR